MITKNDFNTTPAEIKGDTPQLQTRRLEVRIEREHIENEAREVDVKYQWRFCCSDRPTDSRLLTYCITMGIISLSIGFCLVMLSRVHGDCSASQVYLGLLTLLIGAVLPSPRLTR